MKQLKELSKKTGVPMSEILRRMLKEYFNKGFSNDKRGDIQ